MHYHRVDVGNWIKELAARQRASLSDLLTPPLLKDRELQPDEIQRELDNNAQGILGYVVRWVDQGIGCSKIPDINNVRFDGGSGDAADFESAYRQLAPPRDCHEGASHRNLPTDGEDR